jgi:hypothetical protein
MKPALKCLTMLLSVAAALVLSGCAPGGLGARHHHPGESCDGFVGDTCSAREFCHHEIGNCTANNVGTCIRVPATCTKEYVPVCGCDGVTYPNACMAAANRQNVRFEGTCEHEKSQGPSGKLSVLPVSLCSASSSRAFVAYSNGVVEHCVISSVGPPKCVRVPTPSAVPASVTALACPPNSPSHAWVGLSDGSVVLCSGDVQRPETQRCLRMP